MTQKQVLMLVLPTRGTLIDVHDRLHELPYLKVKHAAVIVKAKDGETQVLDDDVHVDEGAITGGTIGAMISALGIAGLGAFLLPGVGAILAIGAGALIGGLIGGATGGALAGLIDSGFHDEQIKHLASRLEAGKVAVVYEFEVENRITDRLRADLAAFQAEVLEPELAQ